jgi:hypothetical protein
MNNIIWHNVQQKKAISYYEVFNIVAMLFYENTF